MRLSAFLTYLLLTSTVVAQESVYLTPPPVQPPLYRVRYEASTEAGKLVYPVSYTIWLPPGVEKIRGVVVHQHGCGEGSCKSGQTGAFDLHWQALARRHGCALLSPVYEQPDKANCQLWCDPRNGSDVAFQSGLADLGQQTGHPELATVPWALWGHSGGGHWCGAMALMHPKRVVAAWLRSGVPPIVAAEGKPAPHSISEEACQVPLMCNVGTKEGVTDKESRFAGVWPGNENFFKTLRGRGALIGVAIDPFSSHDCGNQRYLAIPWLDACLSARLPKTAGEPLQTLLPEAGWLAPLEAGNTNPTAAVPAAKFTGKPLEAIWLPSESMAVAWLEYTRDSAVGDKTPPPAPANVRVENGVVTWTAEADLESGLARFHIERDGQPLMSLPANGKNPFGRPLFQGLSYSDTPTQPLVTMTFQDTTAVAGSNHKYKVISENTVGLRSR